MNKLNIKALGLTLGIVWASGVFLVGLVSIFTSWGLGFVTLIGSMYIGYTNTFSGIFIGTIWGFCDGVICGVLIAWLYNKISRN